MVVVGCCFGSNSNGCILLSVKLFGIIVIIEFILVLKQQMELKLKVSFAVIANHSNHFYLNYSVLAIIHLLINPIITAIIIIHR